MNAHAAAERLSDDEVRRAQAVDVSQLIGRDIKLSRDGRWLVGLCPFHKEKTPSFKVKDGRFYCFGCGAKGDGIEWVQRTQNLSFVDAVRYLTGSEARPQLRIVSREKHPSADYTNPDVIRARGIWRQGVGVTGTVVETYLRGRGLSIFPESVRAIANYNWFADLVLPCMVVAVQGPTGGIIAVQLTALVLNGTRKAFASGSRRTEGVLAAGAARFAAASHTLGIAEGSEKAIAAQELAGVPCWASLGAHRMSSVHIPETVHELHIFADNDEPGREAAERTAKRWNHRRVIVRMPPDGFKDWDEILIARRRL